MVSGFLAGQSPQPNVVVIDTGQMLTHPNQAIVATTTVANGAQTNGLTIATISTAMPPLAPTVHSVMDGQSTTLRIRCTFLEIISSRARWCELAACCR